MAVKPLIEGKRPLLGSEQYDEQFPERIAVWKGMFSGLWWVDRRSPHICTSRPTHAEAIAYAQKVAHQDTDCTHRCGACRDLSHEHIACCPERRHA